MTSLFVQHIHLKKCYLSFSLPLSFKYSLFSWKKATCYQLIKGKARTYKPNQCPLSLRASVVQTSSVPLLGVSSLFQLYSAVGSSFSLILFSEIGDKTFFLAALLAMKYPKRIVFVATVMALVVMTILSVLIGQLFHVFPSQLHTLPIDDYVATALLFWFGVDNMRAFFQDNKSSSNTDKWQDELYKNASTSEFQYGTFDFRNAALRQILQVFSVIFTAEWGDKSMLATVALSATQPPFAVMTGKPKIPFICNTKIVMCHY